MNSRILNRIYIGIALGALFGVLLLRSNDGRYPAARIITGSTSIPVTVADTPSLREKGLSNTLSLPPGTGKLFLFDIADTKGFWMKDMHYPIDIVWIDSNWKVVGVSEAVDPSSYPAVFYSPVPVQYVIEVNAHESAKDGLIVDAHLRLEK